MVLFTFSHRSGKRMEYSAAPGAQDVKSKELFCNIVANYTGEYNIISKHQKIVMAVRNICVYGGHRKKRAAR